MWKQANSLGWDGRQKGTSHSRRSSGWPSWCPQTHATTGHGHWEPAHCGVPMVTQSTAVGVEYNSEASSLCPEPSKSHSIVLKQNFNAQTHFFPPHSIGTCLWLRILFALAVGPPLFTFLNFQPSFFTSIFMFCNYFLSQVINQASEPCDCPS